MILPNSHQKFRSSLYFHSWFANLFQCSRFISFLFFLIPFAGIDLKKNKDIAIDGIPHPTTQPSLSTSHPFTIRPRLAWCLERWDVREVSELWRRSNAYFNDEVGVVLNLGWEKHMQKTSPTCNVRWSHTDFVWFCFFNLYIVLLFWTFKGIPKSRTTISFMLLW